MDGNGSEVFPRSLTIRFEFLYLARDLVPVGLGATTNAAQVRMQVGRVCELFQYD